MLSKENITKGVPAQFTIDKNELANLVPSESYFKISSNWKQIILNYRSSGSHKQNVFVRMDATLSSPVGDFKISAKAQNHFEIIYISIYDFDGGKFIIRRDLLPTAYFDISLI